MGYKCYPSLAAVPEVPDLVIVAVGARRAEQALEECIAKGARNIHMFTAGFAETGEEEGASLAERLREVARRGKLNIVGPNCMGIYSPRGRISPWGELPTEVGPIAMITQSGALGSEFVRLAPDYGLLMSKVISYGNGYVLDSTDYLEYLERDPDTKYIAMYLEGVQDGAKLLTHGEADLAQETHRHLEGRPHGGGRQGGGLSHRRSRRAGGRLGRLLRSIRGGSGELK